MNRKYKISVCGSGFGGNIHTCHAYIEWDGEKETIEDFCKKSRSAIFQQGYNILHWTGINDLESAKVLFIMHKEERLCRYILECCDKYKQFSEMLEHLAYFKKYGKQKSEKYKGYTYVDRNGETHFCVSGGWEQNRIEEVMQQEKNKVSVVHKTLDLLGVDVDDKEGTKQILTNLGFYRVP